MLENVILSEAKDLVMATTRSFGATTHNGRLSG